MYRPRLIPTLLLSRRGIVKTQRFRNPVYIGDPINIARIFNDKGVDELILLDIDASRLGQEPDYDLIEELASECFMPLTYGGGITREDQAQQVLRLGVEKLCLQTAIVQSPDLLLKLSSRFGSQACVASIDIRRRRFGAYNVVNSAHQFQVKASLDDVLHHVVSQGAGEVLVTAVEREGLRTGMDLNLIRHVARLIPIPLVAQGGAGTLNHAREALDAGADAVAAGSMFVFHGPHRAVLISYPDAED